MTDTQSRSRADFPPQYKWNDTSVFAGPQAWAAEYELLGRQLADLAAFQGQLNQGPAVVLRALETYLALYQRVLTVHVYAGMAHKVDTTDGAANAMWSQAQSLYGRTLAAGAFLQPELITVGQVRLLNWMENEPALKVYAHYFENLFRKEAHIRSAEVEQLLGMLADPFGGPETTAQALTDADFKFPPAHTEDGRELPVTQGSFQRILNTSDREARRTAYEGYYDTFLAFKNTLANNLVTSIKQNVFQARARRHETTLKAALFENNIPVEVFYNLISTFRKNLPIWHRYWAVRRRALGVETLHPYDVWAPLTLEQVHVPYEQAVEYICAGLAPMGEEYVRTLRRGVLEERWVDVFPNRGKFSGAFSWGAPGMHPFIVMSFNENVLSLSTLAHELGHSMHSYHTWHAQPMQYAEYSLFAAEVASNFHQALVRAYLLEHVREPLFQIRLVEEAMSNFHRYFFIMPTLARFELEMHERVERGEGLTAELMNDRMADLFAEGYGSAMQFDRERVGITWAAFSHLYTDYYVFQYATGISGANALARRILNGTPHAVEDYIGFLQAGSSLYPLDALKRAGVDLTTPEPVEAAFQVLSGLVDRLEALFPA